MFAKPFSLLLVYILTIFNMLILTSPIVAAAIPFISIKDSVISLDHGVYSQIKFTFFLVAFLVSFCMLIYLVLDFLFGFSVRASLKGCTRYEKVKSYDFLTDIFNQVKSKFGEKHVKLYVKNSNEINAYAVSSLNSRAIVLTRGLIDHYLSSTSDPKTFLYSLRGVMGHEMSHLINRDFLPTFLIIVNQKITNFVSNILYHIFSFGIGIARYTPYIGSQTVLVMTKTYTALNIVITAFNRLVVYNIYEFLRRGVMRFIEYRCDRQSAKAFGGQSMAQALSMLGDNGYFTLFSTHPATKLRMKRVQDLKIVDSTIRAGFFDSLANYLALMLLPITCLYFAKQAHIDLMLREYIQNHEAIHRKVSTLWHLINKFF